MREHTKIAVILDRSGSMGGVIDDTIGGFNTFLAEQKKLPGSADISLYQFDNVYETVYENRPVSEAPELSYANYKPRGGTALYDAIGQTTNSLGAALSSLPEQDRPNKVIVVVITDGYENASREFNWEQVKEMIQRQEQTYSWEYVYLGATPDAVSIATGLGFKGGSSAQYNSANTAQAFAAVSKGVGTYRGMSVADREQLTSGGLDLFDAADRKALS